MANSVDPDETARYEPSDLDLHCYTGMGPNGFLSMVEEIQCSSLETLDIFYFCIIF